MDGGRGTGTYLKGRGEDRKRPQVEARLRKAPVGQAEQDRDDGAENEAEKQRLR